MGFRGELLKESCHGAIPLAAYRSESVASNLGEQLDLNRLRTRVREKPRTKVGQVRQAWPDIRDLLAAGHSLKDVWAWLKEIGLEIGYARLSHYIGQLRRRDEGAQSQIRAPKAGTVRSRCARFSRPKRGRLCERQGSPVVLGTDRSITARNVIRSQTFWSARETDPVSTTTLNPIPRN